MNKDTVIEIETPCGTTEKVKVGDIVKQGTVLGPTLCCVSIDQVNKIGENQERSLGNEIIAIVVFVDDVMSAGCAEDGRKAIRNFKELEDLKKVTYGLKKTKYMVMNQWRHGSGGGPEGQNGWGAPSTGYFRVELFFSFGLPPFHSLLT